MSLTVADAGTSFKIVPPGVYVARCFRLVDLGTQEETFEGEVKKIPKLMVFWELHGEDEAGEPLAKDDGSPMTIHQEFTASLGKKAKLRAALESWRGRPFTPEELKGFDMARLVGAYCMVNVTHRTSTASGKTFATVASLTPLPAAMRHAKPAPVLDNEVFDMSRPDPAVLAAMPDWVRQKVEASEERRPPPEMPPAARNGYADAKSGRTPSLASTGFDDMHDDIPI